MYNEYPFEHNDENESHIPLDSSQYRVGPAFHSEETGSGMHRSPKKKKGKWVAICLACLIVLGAAGGVGYYIATSGDSGAQTTLQIGQREPVQLNTTRVSTDEKMTLPEVYAAYVDSTVGISTEVSSTNVFGQRVSGVATGSGFVISEDGYILTNYHVVEGAKSIQVTMYDETKYDATLVGYDEDNDVAVLKVDATGLKPVVLGDSSQMNVGESVMAIGNPLGELTFTYTTGIISALNRSVTVSGTSYNMIQTDCAINEGNSGGPLFNEYGEVIGIVSAKYASSEIEGLGFAIPINNVLELVEDILQNGRVTGKPSMGISVSTVTEAVAQQYNLQVGACVNEVQAGSCAEKAGLKQGDIITAIGDTKVTTSDELVSAKKEYRAGETTTLTVFRNGESITLSITFDEETQTMDTTETTDDTAQEEQIPGENGNGYYGSPFEGYGF